MPTAKNRQAEPDLPKNDSSTSADVTSERYAMIPIRQNARLDQPWIPLLTAVLCSVIGSTAAAPQATGADDATQFPDSVFIQQKSDRKPRPVMDPQTILAGLKSHDRALYIKAGWIRDPYITLGPDDHYYLTGTQPNPGDPRGRGPLQHRPGRHEHRR